MLTPTDTMSILNFSIFFLDSFNVSLTSVLRTLVSETMDFTKALALSIGELTEPVITRYRLGVIIHNLYSRKSYQGEALGRLDKDYASIDQFYPALSNLESTGILKSHPNFKGRVFQILGRKAESNEEVVCAIDPFCYVSHLSAMSHHGLTDRLPTTLFLSGPDSKRWGEEAERRMEKDLKDEFEIYLSNDLPRLERINMTHIGRAEIHRFNSVHWGAYKNVRGKATRVATIGRTFLDMLRNPDLCGGIHHVIEVYEEYAQTYLPAILNEFDQNGAPIDKVRAGYILEEKIGLKDPRITEWEKFAARGGSRRLDAKGEYIPEWSDKWCLSINI